MDVAELLVREAVHDTIARYNHAGDRGRFDAMVECFIPDGVLVIHDTDRHEGRDALRAFFSGVRGTTDSSRTLTTLRHNVTNTLIELAPSGDAATARSYFTVVTDIGVDHWGTYLDRLVPDASTSRWLFASRSVRTDGYAPNSYFKAG
ncbi:MAG TPA: nuclear transport factor 2 family protein [Acidimicrobiia bacterium]|jgi:ketosteroid isomerase-like protein